MQEEKKPVGIGVGLDINLRIGELGSTLTQLTEALQQTGEKAAGTIANAVRKLRDAGVKDLRQAKQKESGRGEATEMYDKIVGQLRSAAQRGEAEARNLLGELGEKVEAAGQQTQQTAAQGQGQQRQPR